MALTRRLTPGETLQLGEDITITVLQKSRGNKVWLEINAPREIAIFPVKDQQDTTCR